MAEDFEALIAALQAKAIASFTREQIPTVEPEQIKSAWNLEMEGVALSQDSVSVGTVFGPGADIDSIGFRKIQLSFARHFTEAGLIEFPYFRDGKPEDVVFKAFATVPMKGYHKGMDQFFPFDPEELIRIIQNEPEGYTCNGYTIPEDVKTNLKSSLAEFPFPQSSQS